MAFDTEELESPAGRIENGTWQATRKIWLKKPSEFDSYVADLLGTSFSSGTGVVQGASQTYPGKPWLILKSIDYEGAHDTEKSGGKDVDGNAIDAKDEFSVFQPSYGYIFTLVYETPTFDQGTLGDPGNQDLPELPTDTFLTVKISKGMEVLAIDKAGLRWQTADASGGFSVGVNTSVAHLVPTETINLTWHRIQFPPWTNINNLRGKVNDDTFLGHQVGTVLFNGLDGTREFQVNGEREWQLDYKFSVKEVKFTHPVTGEEIAGWNEFYRPNPAANSPHWETIVTSDTKLIYPQDDLTQLFVSEAPT